MRRLVQLVGCDVRLGLRPELIHHLLAVPSASRCDREELDQAHRTAPGERGYADGASVDLDHEVPAHAHGHRRAPGR
jgi:hypothetical protein